MNIVIDGKKYNAVGGQSVLQLARENNINIPSLCYHSDLCVKANCRLCLIEIKGRKGLFTSCSTMVEEEMEIVTTSSDIDKARRINLELLFAQHVEKCPDCIYRYNCELLKMAKEYSVNINRFKDRKIGFPIYEFGGNYADLLSISYALPAMPIFDTNCIIHSKRFIYLAQNIGTIFFNFFPNFQEIKQVCRHRAIVAFYHITMIQILRK